MYKFDEMFILNFFFIVIFGFVVYVGEGDWVVIILIEIVVWFFDVG